ncbi:MAG: hypothetical protein KA274_08270 [Ilumatobacteraceae bacterium]|nr:hypothetical protein [Acidimicrobiaceae bacterium]MBP6487657.1 hypothetical protein [Ilumatobacteraceae bacterium]MBP7890701.1 hypothetical protein [Ilumatobacteraceae bacterium]MBP9052267.1 hypothetical protein [Ilumatobacteraceae bacterium]
MSVLLFGWVGWKAKVGAEPSSVLDRCSQILRSDSGALWRSWRADVEELLAALSHPSAGTTFGLRRPACQQPASLRFFEPSPPRLAGGCRVGRSFGVVDEPPDRRPRLAFEGIDELGDPLGVEQIRSSSAPRPRSRDFTTKRRRKQEPERRRGEQVLDAVVQLAHVQALEDRCRHRSRQPVGRLESHAPHPGYVTIGDDLNMQVPARQVATLDAFDPDDRRPNVSPFHAQPSLLSLLPLL